MPEPGSKDAVVEFKNFDKQYKAPFVIYADFEALTKPVSPATPKGDTSYTNAYQTHEACGYTIHIVSSDPQRKFKPIVFRGDCEANVIQEFIFQMNELEKMLTPLVKAVEPMVMTDQDKQDFGCAEKQVQH